MNVAVVIIIFGIGIVVGIIVGAISDAIVEAREKRRHAWIAERFDAHKGAEPCENCSAQNGPQGA